MELIVHNKWKSLCDAEYSADNPELPPDGSVVFVHMEHIYQFFKDVARTNNRYVLVSADSDYCFVEQAHHPVWNDMRKWLNFTPIEPALRYDPFIMGPRCNVPFCKLDDQFAIKVYSYTIATIDMIPKNIACWFTTNCDLSYPGIVHIPFGIPEWNVESITKGRQAGLHQNKNRKGEIYVNFQKNTVERAALIQNYMTRFSTWYVGEPVSHEKYIEDLFQMKFVLAPPGNGFDCFRTLEAIYCGATAIITDEPYNEPYKNFQVHMTDNLLSCQPFERYETGDLSNTTLDLAYWRSRFEAEKHSLALDIADGV